MVLKKCVCLMLLFVFLVVVAMPPVYAEAGSEIVLEILSVEKGDKISFSEAEYQDGAVIIRGTTAEGMRAGVSMRVFDSNTREVISIDQTAADVKCRFEMLFVPDSHEKISLVLAGENTEVTRVSLTLSDSRASERIKTLREALPACEELFAQCRQKGINTDYETLYYNMILRSVEVMTDEAGLKTDSNIIDYNIKVAYQYLNVILTNLRAYLSGEKTPYSVPMVQPDAISYSGRSFIGTVLEEGRTKTQPVFLNGYCSGFDDKDETENLTALGQNMAGERLPFVNVIGELGYPAGWNLNPGSAGYPDAAYTVTDEEKASGNSSLKIVNRSAAAENKNGYLWQKIVVDPNTTYRFGGKYKGNAQNVTVSFGWGNTVAEIKGATTRWRNFDSVYTTSSEQSGEMMILIYLNDVAEGLYLDDFYLYEGTSTVNLLANPGFEYTYTDCGKGDIGICMGMVQEFKEKLDRYYANGVSVVLDPELYGLSSLLKNEPLARESGKTYSSHLPYNITHPKVLELTQLYFNTVLPVIKDCKSLKALQVVNEPTFSTNGSAYYAPQWSQWLEDKYQTISKLNNVYQTAYGDFSAVPMNSDSTSMNAHYNDWREFNGSIMTKYHKEVSDYIHTAAPALGVLTKVMMYTAGYEQSRFLGTGTNYEDMAAAFDINGNDAWAYIGTGDTIFSTNMWYDLQTSILNRPVFNLENHVVLDQKNINYSRDYAGHYRSAVWQGALHGLGGNLTWLWGKSDHMDAGIFRNTTMQYRLDCMIEGGKLTYDLNRLAGEVSALANKEPDVAILYSYTSPVYDRAHEPQMAKVYQGLLCKGMKPVFVTEEDFSNLDKCKVLIVPYARYVPEKALDSVLAAADSGKKIILLDADSLKYNENKQEQSQDKLTALKNAAQIYTLGEISAMTEAVNAQYNSSKVSVTKSGGKDSVEISSVRTGNRVIINLCNLDEKETQTVSVQYDGKSMGKCIDLINGAEYDTANIILPPLTPVMLEYEVNNLIFSKENGEVIASTLWRDFTDTETNAVLYLAAYDSGGRLVAAASDSGALTETAAGISARLSANYLDNGGYIRAFLWKENTMQPLCGSKLFREE